MSRRITTAVLGLAASESFTFTPLVPAERIPANVPVPLIVTLLVIVTVPKPPGSSTEISPFMAVFEIAPANVLHGAVRLHGLASSPTPETQVRVACANPAVENPTKRVAPRRERRIVDLDI